MCLRAMVVSMCPYTCAVVISLMTGHTWFVENANDCFASSDDDRGRRRLRWYSEMRHWQRQLTAYNKQTYTYDCICFDEVPNGTCLPNMSEWKKFLFSPIIRIRIVKAERAGAHQMRVQIRVIMSFGHRYVLDLAWCSPFQCGRAPNSHIHSSERDPVPVFVHGWGWPTCAFLGRSDALIEPLEQVRPLKRLWRDGIIDGWIVMWHFPAYLLISFFPLYSFILFSLHRIPFDSKMCSQRKFIRHRHQVLLFALFRYHSVSTVPMCACIDAVRTSRPSSKMFTFRTNNGNARAR